jgi:hypothetical protein
MIFCSVVMVAFFEIGLDDWAGFDASMFFQQVPERFVGKLLKFSCSLTSALEQRTKSSSPYAEAEGRYRHALSIREQAIGASNSDVAGLLIGLVGVSPKRALAIEEQALGANHLIVASTLKNMANVSQPRWVRRGGGAPAPPTLC